MTETLRDRLAAVLGPGNNDTTAYTQADAVLDVLRNEIDIIESDIPDDATGDLDFRGHIVRMFGANRQPI